MIYSVVRQNVENGRCCKRAILHPSLMGFCYRGKKSFEKDDVDFSIPDNVNSQYIPRLRKRFLQVLSFFFFFFFFWFDFVYLTLTCTRVYQKYAVKVPLKGISMTCKNIDSLYVSDCTFFSNLAVSSTKHPKSD